MMKKLIAILIGLILSNGATVDRVENGITTIEVCHHGEVEVVDIPTEDFNTPKVEGEKLNISKVRGSFSEGIETLDGEIGYQFKSYDNAVWWFLTADKIGFVPEVNKSYTLIYYNNGTTDCTECAEEDDCECEVYDDIFLTIK